MASLLHMVSVPSRISPTSHTRTTSLQSRPVLPPFSVSFSRRRLSIRATETDTNEVQSQAPGTAPSKDGSSFNQLLGIKGAAQETENRSDDLSWDTLHYVYELVKNGNAAFRKNRMEEAINLYSRANNIKSGDPIILSNRSAAYIRISEYFMHKTSSSSEHRPLSGLEPTTLAELGLKDAEKLVELQSNSAKSYLLKARALLLENSPTLDLYLLDGDLLSEGQVWIGHEY